MVDFVFRRSVLHIREMAFGSFADTACKKCDAVYLHSNDSLDYSSEKTLCLSEKQYTLENDLSIGEEDIWLSFRKTYRNEIRRAEKADNAIVQFFDKTSNELELVLAQFEEIYNSMFEAKDMSNRFNRRLVEAGIKCGQVLISMCESVETHHKVFHAYLYDKNRTVLMYSASPLWENDNKEMGNQIGRLNKYLHWMDIKHFKEIGCNTYEWGGINSVDSPNGIAKFKMGFGGKVNTYYNYTVANSPLGCAYVWMVKRKKRYA